MSLNFRELWIAKVNSLDATRPDFANGYDVTVYPVGAVVRTARTADIIDVQVGHGFRPGDKYLLNPGTANTFSGTDTVQSVTATTIVMGQSVTVVVGDILVNLGADTGTSSPNYDASPLLIYSDADGTTAISNSRVTASAAGEYSYYHRGDGRFWELIRDGEDVPVKVVRFYIRSFADNREMFSDGDATPSVLSAVLFSTANTSATAITGFDAGLDGQQIDVIIGDDLTTFDFTDTALKGNGGRDYLAATGDIIRARYDGTNWHCEISQPQTNRADTFIRPEHASPPSGFDWNPPIHIWKDQHGVFQTDIDVESKAPQGAGVAYYVDPVNGGDGNAGTTRATALQSIATALGKGDIDIMYLVPGLYLRNRTWGGTAISRNLSVYVLDGGRAILSRAMNGLSWSSHSGNAWKATTSAVEAVYDVTNRDANGDYLVLTEESSVANVVSNPGTWILDSGELYVHTTDGREPDSDVDLRVFRTDNYAGNFLADKILYCENVSFEGGNTACFRIRNNSADGVCKGYFKNCSFKYGTNSEGFNGQGVTELFLLNCISACNVADGLNYDLLNNVDCKVLEINCVCRNNGTASDTIVNGSSGHDDSRVVRVNCTYHNNGGPNAVEVGTSQTWCLGCAAYESIAATPLANYNFGCATDAEMWLDGCYSWGSSYDYGVSNNSVLKVRRCSDGRTTASGSIGSY